MVGEAGGGVFPVHEPFLRAGNKLAGELVGMVGSGVV